jgi:hypothetical protein
MTSGEGSQKYKQVVVALAGLGCAVLAYKLKNNYYQFDKLAPAIKGLTQEYMEIRRKAFYG